MVLLGQPIGFEVPITKSNCAYTTVEISIPKDVVGQEVHLLWDNGSEALVYQDGVPVQSLYGGGGDDRREEFVLTKNSVGGEKYLLYIEMVRPHDCSVC